MTEAATRKDLIWITDEGDIDFDEAMMEEWFAAAVENLSVYEVSDESTAWMLFLMGAETAVRGNIGDHPYGGSA